MSSALHPVQKALAAAITASVALQALLSGFMVYQWQRPETITVDGENIPTPYDYVTLGSKSESGFNTFDRAGNRGAYFVHIWTRKDQLSAIYAALEVLLNGKQLVLESGAMVVGTLEYVADSMDADGKTEHGVTLYRVISQA